MMQGYTQEPFASSSRETSEWIEWEGENLVGINEDGSDKRRHFRYVQCRACGRRSVIKERFCPSCGRGMRNGLGASKAPEESLREPRRDVEDYRRYDLVADRSGSDGAPTAGHSTDIAILFNTRVISEEEVAALVEAGEYEYDYRVICTTPEQADAFCRGIAPRL